MIKMNLYLCTLTFVLLVAGAVSGQSANGKKYHVISNTRVAWHKALQYCMVRGWRLPSITSQQENNEIIKRIKDSGTNLGNEPYFFWMGHEEPLTFNDWWNGEPNNYHLNEDCIELKYKNGTWKWNDTTCDSKLYFVCEESA